jgi:hypothetical protein
VNIRGEALFTSILRGKAHLLALFAHREEMMMMHWWRIWAKYKHFELKLDPM